MSRVTRIAGSFAIVVIVYWAYALLAVRWIEPPVDLRSDGEITEAERERAAKFADVRLKQLEGLFPPGAWELQNPKILESDRAKLLFQDYKNFPDGRVELHPCTIVFGYEGPAKDEEQRRRQSVILEAPAGAVLQFDQPLDLNRAKIGRLVYGQLRDEVRIRSDWKEPGPEDDLLIVTRDIQLTEQTISTPNPVDFRWGPHFGRGQEMIIKLLAGPPQPGSEGVGPNIAGIESFELRHIERLHLDLGQATKPRPAVAPDADARPPVAASSPNSVPVEINCSGPFRFDAVGRVATFHDRVDVMKENPAGPSDQIACDLLSLYFTERSKASEKAPGKPDPKAAGSLDLVAQRIEAQGNPVVVTAPSQKEHGGVVNARGQRLQYDLQAGTISLDGGQEVFLQQAANEIHARKLDYQSAGPGRLGRVAAQGPGWLRGRSADRPDQVLEAVWKDKLLVEPDQQEQRITLNGGAELNFPGVGQLQAREILLWLAEKSRATANQPSDLRPNRMSASNDVHLNSPQLSAKVQQLEVWFEEGARGQGPGTRDQTAVDEKRPGTAVPGVPAAAAVPPPPQQYAQPRAGVARAGVAVEPPPQQNTPPPPTPLQRFEVVGRLLRARILLGQQQTAVSNLSIEDGVDFTETQTSEPNQQPLHISGNRLDAVDVSTPNATVKIIGQPARFEGRGLALTGANINLNRGANRLSIDGPGQMQVLPTSASPQGQSPVPTGPMTVDWRQGMDFDGRTAKFTAETPDGVVATAGQQLLRTQTMTVQLQWPISFSQPNSQAAPQVEMIGCLGGVSMEQRTFDHQQQLASYDRLEVTKLDLNALTGELKAGPGWLNHVWLGSDNPLGNPAAPAGGGNEPQAAVPVQDQLKCLHVQFQDSLTGSVPRNNASRRQLTFAGHVQMTFATVDNWDAMLTTNNPDKLNLGGVVGHCDQLSVVQMPPPVGDRQAIEFEALGNAVIEGTTFTARGNRLSYAQAKDLLILEGDGRNNAELFRQLQPGGPIEKQVAQKIFYWPKKRLHVIGVQSLQFGQPPNTNRMQ